MLPEMTKTYEPCQVRKEAAISSHLWVFLGCVIHTDIYAIFRIKESVIWGIEHYIENLDH